MELTYRGARVPVFTVAPRTEDVARYWPDVTRVIQLSEAHGCEGMLIFTGNDVVVEPWIAAHALVTSTRRLTPLVAVNPIYMHPYTVAKMIATFAHLHQRRVRLNLVTGAALSYQAALGDEVPHDERYDRLGEYLSAIRALLSRPRATLKGSYYRLAAAQVLPRVPPELAPEFFLAGQSPAARRVAQEHGATSLHMLGPKLAGGVGADQRSIHFGMVVRETEGEAWTAARALFPEDPDRAEVLDMTMSNTDSDWKIKLRTAADRVPHEEPGFWLAPFRHMQADCPYFVGSEAQASALLADLVVAGITSFVLDIAPSDEEFRRIDGAFARAAEALAARG